MNGISPTRQRLAGLDGIRGLAALFVVINHVFLRAFPGYPVDHAPFWAGWFTGSFWGGWIDWDNHNCWSGNVFATSVPSPLPACR